MRGTDHDARVDLLTAGEGAAPQVVATSAQPGNSRGRRPRPRPRGSSRAEQRPPRPGRRSPRPSRRAGKPQAPGWPCGPRQCDGATSSSRCPRSQPTRADPTGHRRTARRAWRRWRSTPRIRSAMLPVGGPGWHPPPAAASSSAPVARRGVTPPQVARAVGAQPRRYLVQHRPEHPAERGRCASYRSYAAAWAARKLRDLGLPLPWSAAATAGRGRPPGARSTGPAGTRDSRAEQVQVAEGAGAAAGPRRGATSPCSPGQEAGSSSPQPHRLPGRSQISTSRTALAR